jgi:trehalose 6-phosphate synthase/phosphatase
MNLVAKEYIALQPEKYDPDSLVRPGTLILSEFTGAAQELFNATLVNPYNSREVAEAMKRSLDLPYEERIQNNRPMIDRVRVQDSSYWSYNFLKDLQTEVPLPDKCQVSHVSSLVSPFLSTSPGRKILFLDYDGTLTPIVSSPHLAVPSDRLLRIMNVISDRKDLDIVIVSGRTQEFLSNHFGKFSTPNKNFTLVAEHGYKIKYPDVEWKIAKESIIVDWKSKIIPYLELYVKTTPGSFIEEKLSAIVWHYRKSDVELASKRAADLVGQLSEFIHNLPVEIHHGKKIVEVSTIEINKGQVVKEFLQSSTKEYTAALCVGDDTTDETMFRVQSNILTKVKIGDGDTAATYRWPTSYHTIEFLSLIAK